MKKMNRTPLLPIGISALALMAISVPACAQETNATPAAAAPIAAPADSSAKDDQATDATQAPEGQGTAARSFPEETDPYVAQDVKRLDDLGVVTRQARIGEDILVIDREIRRAQAVDQLVGYYGRDAFEKAYPELAKDLEKSPILLRAELAKQELFNEIEAAKADKDAEAKKDTGPKPRDDGSSFFTMVPPAAGPAIEPSTDGKPAPTNGPAATETEAKPAPSTVIDDTKAKVEEEKPKDVPISVRQIYGVGDDLTAVIDRGGELIRVRAGDTLPNDTRIEFVGDDYVKLKRHGEVIRMQIRG